MLQYLFTLFVVVIHDEERFALSPEVLDTCIVPAVVTDGKFKVIEE